MSDGQVSEAFVRCCELGLATGMRDMSKFVGCWERQVDDRWRIVFNPGQDERKHTFTGEDRPAIVVPRLSFYVEYNGWPAGIVEPAGGIIAAGSGANENSFIAALVAATEKLGDSHV